MNEVGDRDTGRLAIAVGAVAVGSAACLATFSVVQGPFGTLNDIGNAATGLLSGLLIWRLRRQLATGPAVVGAALVGAALTVAGSALVISGTTGFLFAGLVSGVGFAAIGGSLVALNRSSAAVAAWPRAIRRLGVAAGALMAAGVVLVPGILLGLDDAATAPGWVWLGFLGWFGTFLALPAWAIGLGLEMTRRPVAASRLPGALEG